MRKHLLYTLLMSAVVMTMGAQTGSKDAPLSVSEFLALGVPESAVADTYVEGYIVGYVDGGKLETGAHFDLNEITASNNTNLLLAGTSSEKNVEACIPVALPSGNIRNELNLAANSQNFGHGIVLCGSREKYFGVVGLKSVTSYEWVGEAPEEPVVTPPTEAETGTEANPLTVADYLKLGTPLKPVENTWLTGYIVGSVTDKSIESAEMGASENSSASNILVAGTQNPASISECIPVQLPAGDIRDVLNLKDNPGNVGKTVVLCGTRENYYGVLGMKSVVKYTLDGEVVVPTLPYGTFYKGLVSNADDWTLNVGTVPEGLNYVWAWDAQYGLKASAYFNSTRFATDIYAVSPEIDLTYAKTAELTFSQCANYANGDVSGLTVNVREGEGAWTAVQVEGLPTGSDWKFVDSKANLDAYAGKKIQIGLRYTSSDTVAPTWEVKDMVIEGDPDPNAVEEVVADAAVYVENGNIVAPAGARAYNLQGVETGLNSLPAGIYVVVVDAKAVKVLVK